ncbi:MAG: hypothetical protein DWQ05_05810 [Calditrichaeota bacterium]|nr:MAG: hypothetical protein DWQ05_05810 [Calditrichota bacterium]
MLSSERVKTDANKSAQLKNNSTRNDFSRLSLIILLTLFSVINLKGQDKNQLPSILENGKNPAIQAMDAPHWGNDIDCMSCHMLHNNEGMQLTKVNGNANLCMSCHNPVGVASGMPFSEADKAIPGTSGTSHAWEVPATNWEFGAELPTNAEMSLRVLDGKIVCSTCHNQHNQNFPPFLRDTNAGNALCKDCHSIRNVGSYRDNTNSRGSHPVGIAYPGSDSRFFPSIQNPNLPLYEQNKIECTTCHSPHYATSGNANNGLGDGFLLREANDEQLCQDCHTYTNHMGQGCTQCHNSHDPARSNILLVRESLSTPNSGTKSVVFTSESGTNSFADGNTTFDGICEVCHTNTNHHQNDGTAPGGQAHHNGENCLICHSHADSFEASADVPPPHDTFACIVCHSDPTTYVVDAVIPNSDCEVCHTPSTLKTHFSEHYTDPVTGQLLDLLCVDCHNPMSTQINIRSNENLDFIRTTIRGNSVIFEATTGSYSFAYDLPDQPGDMTTENYLCNTCHTQTNHHQSDGTAPGGQTHYDGENCISCHPHANGLIPDDGECILCHSGASDNNDFIFGNSTLSKISTTEWNSSGHGRSASSGNYAQSGNPAADLTAAANSGNACLYCHDDNVNHNVNTNPFRLANTSGSDGQNGVCFICHKSGSTGYDPDGSGSMSSKNGTVKVGTAHYGSDHSNTSGGEFCWDCHDPHGDNNVAMVHQSVTQTSDGSYGTPTTTVSTTLSTLGTWNSYVNETAYDGICQVCHTTTDKFRGSTIYNRNHHPNKSCLDCHSHDSNFEHGKSGKNCNGCHGHDDGHNGLPFYGSTISHSTHTENDSDDLRGPFLDCSDCHDTNNYPTFSDGNNLANTNVCDACHSAGGAFNGLNSMGGSVGAKDNWSSSVYNGSSLQSGKEKWCVGCHDQGNSVIDGISAPPVAGDNNSWGYYAKGHGVNNNATCSNCHNLSGAHLDGQARTYSSGSNNYTAGYRLRSDRQMSVPNSFSNGNNINGAQYNMCWQSCHTLNNVLNNSNFGDNEGNLHREHLRNKSGGDESWQSDWSIPLNGPTSDSRPTCPTCHNIHGSDNNFMVRDGRLTNGNGDLNFVGGGGGGGNCNIGHCHGPENYGPENQANKSKLFNQADSTLR